MMGLVELLLMVTVTGIKSKSMRACMRIADCQVMGLSAAGRRGDPRAPTHVRRHSLSTSERTTCVRERVHLFMNNNMYALSPLL